MRKKTFFLKHDKYHEYKCKYIKLIVDNDNLRKSIGIECILKGA